MFKSGLFLRAALLATLTVLPGFGLAQKSTDPVTELLGQIQAGQCSPEFNSSSEGLHPIDQFALTRLQRAVDYYAQIVRTGGWPVIADGRTVGLGDIDPRVRTMRVRLHVSGDLLSSPSDDDPNIASNMFIDAVRRFQTRHGLVADGKVGRETLAAMNVPAIEQI